MPAIFDNQERRLLDALRDVLGGAVAADFCVGHFHPRGWHQLELPEHVWDASLWRLASAPWQS